MIRSLGFGLIVALSALFRPLAAQLRGVVREAGSNSPLAGAVVSAIDSAGASSTRAIADAQGRFVIALPAHAARLHVVRIGYRPQDVAIPAAVGAVLELAMEKIPPLLETMRVTGQELCPGSTERGPAFALWEQARSGLLATIVARELRPADARTITYERGVAPSDELVRHQTTRVKTGSTTRPFVAAAGASYFATVGFMSEVGDGSRIYSAPDADVLLDPAFAATHCFHLQRADAAHRGQIGLAFTPAAGRDTLVDVTGVIWIDQSTPQLRSFDFSYTSLEPAAAKMNAGGHLEFRTMPNGVSFIERWNLRLPVMGQITTNVYRSRTADPLRRQERTDLRVTEITEAGGIVADATWADGTTFRAEPSGIAGVVVQRATNEPVRSAIVTLGGTDDSTITDSAGRFHFDVIPGKYALLAMDTLFREFVAERSERRVVDVVLGHVTAARIEVEQVANVVAEVCKGQPMTQRSLPLSIITGHVIPTIGEMPGDATVRAMWQADYDLDVPGNGIKINTRQFVAPIDDRGRFIVCGVARERPIALELRLGGAGFADTSLRILDTKLTHVVDWHVPPIAADAGTLGGTVVGSGASPLGGADVFIVQLQRQLTTDDLGRFQFAAVRPGRYTILVRHVGYAPLTDTVTVDPRGHASRVMTMTPVTVFDTVRSSVFVAGTRAARRLPPEFRSSPCGTLLLWTREK